MRCCRYSTRHRSFTLLVLSENKCSSHILKFFVQLIHFTWFCKEGLNITFKKCLVYICSYSTRSTHFYFYSLARAFVTFEIRKFSTSSENEYNSFYEWGQWTIWHALFFYVERSNKIGTYTRQHSTMKNINISFPTDADLQKVRLHGAYSYTTFI